MNYFKEFQFATIIFIIAIPAQVFLAIAYITQIGTNPMSTTSYAIANGVFVIIYLLLYGMKTTIDDTTIRISYGIGLITKRIKLEDIASVITVSSPWYYGWGIRIIPNGMLYNIHGSQGVELSFKNTTRIIRIGSANMLELQHAITYASH
jgi:hypothetical protein